MAKIRIKNNQGVSPAKKKAAKKQQKLGPKEERLVIQGNWKKAVKRSFQKRSPSVAGRNEEGPLSGMRQAVLRCFKRVDSLTTSSSVLLR